MAGGYDRLAAAADVAIAEGPKRASYKAKGTDCRAFGFGLGEALHTVMDLADALIEGALGTALGEAIL